MPAGHLAGSDESSLFEELPPREARPRKVVMLAWMPQRDEEEPSDTCDVAARGQEGLQGPGRGRDVLGVTVDARGPRGGWPAPVFLLPLEKISKRYFFETDLLFHLNILSARVVDIPMHSHYADQVSNMKPNREIPGFALAHLRNFGKRIYYNYFIRNFSFASLELVLGFALTSFGIIYGLTLDGFSLRVPVRAIPPGGSIHSATAVLREVRR